MKTCEIRWMKSNKHKIFKDTRKTLQLGATKGLPRLHNYLLGLFTLLKLPKGLFKFYLNYIRAT